MYFPPQMNVMLIIVIYYCLLFNIDPWIDFIDKYVYLTTILLQKSMHYESSYVLSSELGWQIEKSQLIWAIDSVYKVSRGYTGAGTAWFHLYEVSKTVKFIEMESRMAVTKDCR